MALRNGTLSGTQISCWKGADPAMIGVWVRETTSEPPENSPTLQAIDIRCAYVAPHRTGCHATVHGTRAPSNLTVHTISEERLLHRAGSPTAGAPSPEPGALSHGSGS